MNGIDTGCDWLTISQPLSMLSRVSGGIPRRRLTATSASYTFLILMRLKQKVLSVFVSSGRVEASSPKFRQSTISAGTSRRLRSNFLQQMLLEVEPMAGIEPATDGLRNRCSTAELHWHQNRETAREPAKFRSFRNAQTLYQSETRCKQKQSTVQGLLCYLRTACRSPGSCPTTSRSVRGAIWLKLWRELS